MLVLMLSISDESETNNSSSFLITILSMFFTIISILISVFEYILSNNLNKNGTICAIGIRLTLEFDQLYTLEYQEFRSKIVFRHRAFNYSIGKLLHISSSQVERLIPLQVKDGIMFTIIIQADVTNVRHFMNLIKINIDNGNLAREICHVYKLANTAKVSHDDHDFEVFELGKSRAELKSTLNVFNFGHVTTNTRRQLASETSQTSQTSQTHGTNVTIFLCKNNKYLCVQYFCTKKL